MNLHEYQRLLDHPAAKLVAAHNASMVLGFFHRAFKLGHRLTIPEGEMRGILESHLVELRQEDLFAVEKSAQDYLEEWCGMRRGWLRKYYPESGGSSEAVFELTAAAEKALLWLESLHGAEFVGTESRLELIFTELEKLVTLGSGDPTERLAKLREDAARIADEIDRIEASGEVETLSGRVLSERFQWLLATARELLSDFRQVEENFKRIGREIAERHTNSEATRGLIVEHLLDAYEALHETPQGQSFYGFWNLLLANDRQERFRAAIDRAYSLVEVDPSLRSNKSLSQLIGRLLREGEKVVKSNERMAGHLRKVLETGRLGEQRRLREIVREIQTQALLVKENPPTGENFFELQEMAPLFAAMSRDPWRPGESLSAVSIPEEADDSGDRESFRNLGSMPLIRLEKLRQNIASMLEIRGYARLDEVLEAHPPTNGPVEILGYVAVALENPLHLVSEDKEFVFEVAGKKWNVPLILFSRTP
jgi:hypothetical protein